MKKIALLLCLIILFSSMSGCGKLTVKPKQNEAEYSLKDSKLQPGFVCVDNYRVFYEIFVGSFSDSNGDGIGDIRGIINRMDYLNDGEPDSGRSLGVEGIWLTPVFLSPSYHKYDVTNYFQLDPRFGTFDDLRELFNICHERNVKVILDLPINHTGSRCGWFQRFCEAHRSGDLSSGFYDFYSWVPADSPTDGRAFRQIPGCSDLYECNFTEDMPELNFNSEAVRQTLLKVAEFYLELGADGFRFDAAKYIYFGDNGRSAEFWEWYLEELRKIRPDVYTVAEVWDSDPVTDRYYTATNCFNFSLCQADGLIANTARGGSVDSLTFYFQNYLDRVHEINPSAMLIPFVSNHDQDRAAGYLSASDGTMQMAANLYLLGPGSPFIYYGEELGMRGSRGWTDTDADRRLAMVWHDEDTIKDPEGSSFNDQIEAGAAEQLRDPDSLYNYYKQLIMIRNANPEIARGVYRALCIPDSDLGGFTALWGGSAVCVLHNVTDAAITVDLAKIGLGYSGIQASAGMNGAVLNGTVLTVGAKTSVVLK